MSAFELKPLPQNRSCTRLPAMRVQRAIVMPPPRCVRTCESDYWNDFYGYWDGFVADWKKACDEKRNPSDQISELMFSRAKELAANELPEPYLGFPHDKISAVMLNMNPGMSQCTLDHQKFYQETSGTARLYDYFVDKGISYYEFLKQYSSLYSAVECLIGSDKEVCGSDWWQKKRLPWLRRIYNNAMLSADHVFALEICPYHSVGTHGFQDFVTMRRRDDRIAMLGHLWRRVIHPAICATQENGLPFATCIGSGYQMIFEKLHESGFAHVTCDRSWEAGRRMYKVYQVTPKDDAAGGGKGAFVVTWQTRGWGNPPPDDSPRTANIEKEIRRFLGVTNEQTTYCVRDTKSAKQPHKRPAKLM